MLLRLCICSMRELGRSWEILPVSISRVSQENGGTGFVVNGGGGGGPGKELLLTEGEGNMSKFSDGGTILAGCVEMLDFFGCNAGLYDDRLIDGLPGSVADLFF